MIERQFTEDRLAALYDLFSPPKARDDFSFYLPLIMAARSVLDVGCGTGALLRSARESGHTGRLCGLDPAPGMLSVARQRPDIEWVLGDLSSVHWDREFDLIVMTGHVFQHIVEDEAIRTALTAVRSALTDAGRFVFETRNPLDRAWERWPGEYGGEITDATGVLVRRVTRVETPVRGDVVRFTATFTSPAWDRPEISPARLRFLDLQGLSRFLSDAGLAVEEQLGDWDRQPLGDTSPEIITIAKRAGGPPQTVC